MSFAAPAAGYDRFVGRYSVLIAPRFADFAGVAQDGPVLDVGCGPGALTQELAARIGAAHVAAVDPSEPFVAACKARVAGADVRVASGESLPFADHTFAIALSQLVLSFVQDPDRMAREMVRVVKPGGTVGLCMFEANGFALVRTFWDAAVAFDPGAPDDARRPFRRTAPRSSSRSASGPGFVTSPPARSASAPRTTTSRTCGRRSRRASAPPPAIS